MLESTIDYEWRATREHAAKDAFFRTPSLREPVKAEQRVADAGRVR